MDNKSINQKIKFYLLILTIIIVAIVMFFITLRYEVVGESNVPYKLEKIIIVSSAKIVNENDEEAGNIILDGQKIDGNLENSNKENQIEINSEQMQSENNGTEIQEDLDNEKFIWNEKVIQTNDLYIYVNKSEKYKKEEIIKSVRIENINILENVKIGKVQVYMPSSLDDGLYKYVNNFLVNSSLQYRGALQDNSKTLEISNNGGCFCISFANMGLDWYRSNDDVEIAQGAYILKNMNIVDDDLKFKVSFDFVIETEKKSYKTNVNVDLPVDGLVGNKEAHEEIIDLDSLVYKRF